MTGFARTNRFRDEFSRFAEENDTRDTATDKVSEGIPGQAFITATEEQHNGLIKGFNRGDGTFRCRGNGVVVPIGAFDIANKFEAMRNALKLFDGTLDGG